MYVTTQIVLTILLMSGHDLNTTLLIKYVWTTSYYRLKMYRTVEFVINNVSETVASVLFVYFSSFSV